MHTIKSVLTFTSIANPTFMAVSMMSVLASSESQSAITSGNENSLNTQHLYIKFKLNIYSL